MNSNHPNLKGHILSVHVTSVHEGKKPFKCDICSRGFGVKKTLNNYVKSVHEGNKPFKCEISDASFTHKGSFHRHVN